MLRSAFPSSLSEQRPRACGGHTAARLAPFRHHAAATSIARPISTPLPSCKAAPRPRIAVGPGGGPDSGRALGRGPFAPAQASLPSPAPAKNNSSSRLTSNQRRGAAGAPLPPRSAAGEQQLPISSGVQRGKPQQASGEAAQLQTAGNDKQQCNSAAGSSASAQAVVNDVFGVNGGATGQRSASPASNADASAVAAARLLRGALEAALLPRLEAMEGRMGAMEGRIVEAVEGRITQGLMDMVQQREEKAVARERQLTAALEAMAAVMRQQGQGMGEGQQVKGQAAEPQGQRDEGQPLAVTLAAQEQRIREELKAEVMASLRFELQAAVAKMQQEREGQVAAAAAATATAGEATRQASSIQPGGQQQHVTRAPAWQRRLWSFLNDVMSSICVAAYAFVVFALMSLAVSGYAGVSMYDRFMCTLLSGTMLGLGFHAWDRYYCFR